MPVYPLGDPYSQPFMVLMIADITSFSAVFSIPESAIIYKLLKTVQDSLFKLRENLIYEVICATLTDKDNDVIKKTAVL